MTVFEWTGLIGFTALGLGFVLHLYRGSEDSLRLDAGEIAVGKLADCMLVNLDHSGLVPGHNLASDLVYAATPECVDTTICNGQILMRHRQIPGEDEIRRAFRDVAAKL